MVDENKTCPYTGLRPFSEDESLFFKGRDEHIDQATRQLAKNKFLILTGASGDGKSSLVYAGIVPNARAGFLKAAYSNWAVADFRPERTPFHNLCKSIAAQLGIPNIETVKAELGHGFSALVDLYKASPLYVDENDSTWQQTDQSGRMSARRKASNLLVIADQFEEFFTNPENYNKGVPSVDATLVANLLIETAQIALEQNLPIYVVITMRSDFIGQCAAFRGLPEYIGFSQFFVPRLNRRQLQEVIEEPAISNGDRISRRLTERLIHDMVEGTDQLPILQHALNQIWKMAGDGMEEMDLIHYAMVGGIAGRDLPPSDWEILTSWFNALPEEVRGFYNRPSLQNVLNTHANRLMAIASGRDPNGRAIIQTAFKCLTKIDNGRAVRNRMSLAEITSIVDIPGVDTSAVRSVLDIYREPGNTLLKPYITDNPETQRLNPGVVLDITHESLIRNWEHLDEWALEEFNDYSIFLDFEQQLGRWLNSAKSSSFLLYIGPLTYFEAWFAKAKPNEAWIARYLQSDEDTAARTGRAKQLLADSLEFLRRSARKHAITRTIIRVGPRRIAAGIAIAAILILSSFTVVNYMAQRNVTVLAQIKKRSFDLLNSKKVPITTKQDLAIELLRARLATIPEVEHAVTDPIECVSLFNGIAANLRAITMKPRIMDPEVRESLAISDSLLDIYGKPTPALDSLSARLIEVNDYMATLRSCYYFGREPHVSQLIAKNAKRSASMARWIVEHRPKGFDKTSEFNTAVEDALNHNAFTEEDIRYLLSQLSPFETKYDSWLAETYKPGKIETRGVQRQHGARHQGLYLELSFLYASINDMTRVMNCMDTLVRYNQNYHLKSLVTNSDNGLNVIPYLYRYGHRNSIRPFLKSYSALNGIAEEEMYERLLARCKLTGITNITLEVISRDGDIIHNANLEYGTDEELSFYFSQYRDVIQSSGTESADEKNYRLAGTYKDEPLILARRMRAAGIDADTVVAYRSFDRSVDYFKKVSSVYVKKSRATGQFAYMGGYKYPDASVAFHPWEPRTEWNYYCSTLFLNYLVHRNLLRQLYADDESMKYIEMWLEGYGYGQGFSFFMGNPRAETKDLWGIERELGRMEASKKIDLNRLYISIGNAEFMDGRGDKAAEAYARIQPERVYTFIEATRVPFAFSEVVLAGSRLALAGQFKEAERLVKALPNSRSRASMYGFMAQELEMVGRYPAESKMLLDSCRKQIRDDEDHSSRAKLRLISALGFNGTDESKTEIQQVLKNMDDKAMATRRLCRAIAYRGELYNAVNAIPDNTSDIDMADHLIFILYGYSQGKLTMNPFWTAYGDAQWKWEREAIF